MALLEVKNLRTTFRTEDGPVTAVNGLSFSVDSGATLGIVGESGSGKSVTSLSIMRLLSGNATVTAKERLQSIHQSAPARVEEMLAGQRREGLRLDLVDQPARFSDGRNVVEPAPRHHRSRRELEHSVSQRIPVMVIEKQPAI